LQRLVEGGAQQRHLHKIVEMPGLQRSILAVVGEAEHLLRLWRQVRAAHGGNRSQRQQRRGRAAPFARQRGEFAEIFGVAPRIGFAAGETEHKRFALKPAGNRIIGQMIHHLTVGPYLHAHRPVFRILLFELAGSGWLEPVFGQRRRIILPASIAVGHDIAGAALLLVEVLGILQLRRQPAPFSLPVYGVVFLPADTAELEREKQLIAAARRIELSFQRQLAAGRRLQGGVDGASLADELVQL
jgi:hypothetical protein